MKKYLAAILIFIAIIAGILKLIPPPATCEESCLRWWILLYFSVLTIAFHYGVVVTTRKRPQVFVRYFMASTSLKLLLHLGVIVIYCLFHRPMAVPFILTFLIMYFLFTVFEVVVVMRLKDRR